MFFTCVHYSFPIFDWLCFSLSVLAAFRTGEEKDASIFATVTQNGNIYLQKFMNDEHYRILSLTVKDYHLFPYIYKFDVTGQPEIIS